MCMNAKKVCYFVQTATTVDSLFLREFLIPQLRRFGIKLRENKIANMTYIDPSFLQLKSVRQIKPRF